MQARARLETICRSCPSPASPPSKCTDRVISPLQVIGAASDQAAAAAHALQLRAERLRGAAECAAALDAAAGNPARLWGIWLKMCSVAHLSEDSAACAARRLAVVSEARRGPRHNR